MNETSGRRVFVFEDVPDKAVFAYYSGQDQVSARKLFGAYRGPERAGNPAGLKTYRRMNGSYESEGKAGRSDV